MDQQQVKQTAEQFISMLHRIEEGDENGIMEIAELFSDEATLSNSIIEHAQAKDEKKGRDDIVAFWREYQRTFPEIHSEFTDVTTGDSSAALVWRSSGKAPNGKALEYEGVSLLKLGDDNKISSFRAIFDTAQLHSAM